MSSHMQLARPVLDAIDYLQREAEAPQRCEFVNGQAYALSGTSKRHANLVTNLLRLTGEANSRRPGCNVYSQCVKLHVPERNSYYYPDVVATCEPETREAYVVREPCFIVEVLSPTTANIDRREKRTAYMTLPSLEQYVVLDQDRMRADVYIRGSRGWNLALLREPGQIVDFTCLDCALTLEQIYTGVRFPLHIAEEDPEEEWLLV
jgi:Uma2 family endonuclease